MIDRFKRYWPTINEQGEYTGPFSTFAEWHAATYGLMHGAGTAFAYSLGLNAAAIALAVTAMFLFGWVSTDRTEDFPLVQSILDTLPKRIKGQIRREQHYYGGAYLLSAGIVYVAA